MLVLTRKVGQRILIGDDVRLTVLACRGGRISLGIEAARDTPVVREEARGRRLQRLRRHGRAEAQPALPLAGHLVPAK